MRILLYFIWFLIPLTFFTIVLWSKLESLSKKRQRENTGDLLKQSVFVLACVLLCVGIDQLFLADWVEKFSPDWIPLGFYQSILLPLMFLVLGKIAGHSPEIRITKAPHLSDRKRRK